MELAIRTAMTTLGGALLEQLLAVDTGHRGTRIDCGAGHQAGFVSYRSKTVDTVLGPISIDRAYYHCAECGHAVTVWPPSRTTPTTSSRQQREAPHTSRTHSFPGCPRNCDIVLQALEDECWCADGISLVDLEVRLSLDPPRRFLRRADRAG